MANYGLDLTDGLSQLLVIITQFFWGGMLVSKGRVLENIRYKVIQGIRLCSSWTLLLGTVLWPISFRISSDAALTIE